MFSFKFRDPKICINFSVFAEGYFRVKRKFHSERERILENLIEKFEAKYYLSSKHRRKKMKLKCASKNQTVRKQQDKG